MKVSVIIITLNEEVNIRDCIRSSMLLTDDVIVVDSGSNDRTVSLALAHHAKVFNIEWKGYGAARNFGASKAKYDWILALDADERITGQLVHSINATLLDLNYVYYFRRRNFIDQNPIRFGTLGFEKVVRLYHRNIAYWDLTIVHECLHGSFYYKRKLAGYIEHFGFKDLETHKNKLALYANMSAEKYFLEGKNIHLSKKFLSPVFNSIKSYFFQLGFIEGLKGLRLALMIARYSWLKYFYLERLNLQFPKEKAPSGKKYIIEKLRKVLSSEL